MRIEDLKYEFPKMPDEMRAMVEREVEAQIRLGAPGRKVTGYVRKGRRSGRRTAVILVAAALAVGTTAFAGTRIFRMYSEQVGNYGVKTAIQEETVPDSQGDTGTVPEIPQVKLSVSSVPEGMALAPGETAKFHYEDEAKGTGYVSIRAYSMDMGDDAFEILNQDIVSKEEMELSGRDVIYLERQVGVDGSVQGILYVAYPEVHHVMEMFTEGIPKEEVIEMAQGIELVPVEEGETADIGLNWAWSSYIAAEEETEMALPVMETVSQEDMGNTHQIGEAFALNGWASDENGEYVEDASLSVTVSSVQVADDLSLLGDSEYIDDRWLDAVGEDGTLVPDEIQYIKSGDGIDTIDQVVKTEEVAQKLVYVTAEYTNAGDIGLRNILFNGSLLAICQSGEEYVLYDRSAREDGQWDKTENAGVAWLGGMNFFDSHGQGYGNGQNYIDALEPGETATVHMAWVVNEDELPYLYLSFTGDAYNISEEGLETGYVDIRQ